MGPTLSIVVLWLGFAASHMILSSLRLRPRIVSTIGERAFLGLYSLVAFSFFVPLVWVYLSHKHAGPMLWSVAMTPTLEALVSIAMGIAFVLVVAGIVTPSPASLGAVGHGRVEVRGVHRITRHALFMGLGIFGLAHLVPNGFASDVAFFAGFPLFAIAGSLHQDARKLATEAERYGPYHAATRLIPFTGRSALRGLRELPLVAVLVGIGLAVLVRLFHARLFG
jgi:uncharacterized membrane protein